MSPDAKLLESQPKHSVIGHRTHIAATADVMHVCAGAGAVHFAATPEVLDIDRCLTIKLYDISSWAHIGRTVVHKVERRGALTGGSSTTRQWYLQQWALAVLAKHGCA